MNIHKADLLTIEGEQYITIEVLNYEGKDYAFLNKVKGEEVTREFYIFEILEDGLLILDDYETRSKLLPKFEELIKRDIEEIINE